MALLLPLQTPFFFFFSLLTFFTILVPKSNGCIHLSVTKDPSSLQYLTTIHHGTPLSPATVVVDLGGAFLWLHTPFSSPSRPIPCRSVECVTANGLKCANSDCFTPNTSPATPEQSKCSICKLNPKNPITQITVQGDLVTETVSFRSKMDQVSTFDEFFFCRAPPILLKGLANGARGVLGLGRTRIALQSQAMSESSFRTEFAICLSQSEGAILLGGEKPLSVSNTHIWKTLIYTPLVQNLDDSAEDYYISIRSIAINGKRLRIGSIGATKISTSVPYTVMESSIYGAFVEAFAEEAAAMNMSRTETTVAPFEVCFRSDGLGEAPVVDLGLQSEMVKWRVYGENLMVKVSDEVMCLGFMEGRGLRFGGSKMVMGGYQLEEKLLHFDLGGSMLGFSSSLGSSCSSSLSYRGSVTAA